MAYLINSAGQPVITPDSIARRRKVAEAFMSAGADASPIQHWTQGAARVAQALVGALTERRARADEDSARSRASADFNSGAGSAIDRIMGAMGYGAPTAGTSVADGMQFGAPKSDQAKSGNPYRDAIASIESRGSGGYAAMGPRTRSGDRAYGRYQVMGNNIPSWTQEALGYSMTPEQFLADTAAQDAVFDHRFGSYVKKYGNPQDAASAWFTGRPLAQGANARDVLGTSGSGYVDKFNQALTQLGGQPPPSMQDMPPPMRPGMQADPRAMGGADPMAQPSGLSAINSLVAGGLPQASPQAAPQPAAPQPGMTAPAEGGGIGTYSRAQAPGSYLDRTNGLYWTPPAAGGGQGGTRQLLELMSNPWLTEGQQQIIGSLLQADLARMRPDVAEVGGRLVDKRTGQVVYQPPAEAPKPLVVGDTVLDPTTFQPLYQPPQPPPNPTIVDAGQTVLGPDNQPVFTAPAEPGKPTNQQSDYNFYLQQERAAGRQPLSFDDWLASHERTGTLAAGPYGPPPKDSVWRLDAAGNNVLDENRVPIADLIPNSPTWIEQQSKDAKAAGAADASKDQAAIVVQDIGRALNMIDTANIPVTGIGSLASAVPGTPAHDLSQLLDTISANIAFDKLQEMRNNSPTGGALGSITERELALLSSAKGAVAQSQSAQQLKDNLARLNNAYLDVIHGPGNGPPRLPLSFEQQKPGWPAPGTVEDGYRYKGGDPSLPASWEPVN